ncbi:type II secretion system protein J [Deinococcus hohokamensis]|uniref:Type II secretion system protein J n=1 Tax=Deinococcus hohokamensis TaxID=309883 RepID=A0ABV9IDA1_9DEIO
MQKPTRFTDHRRAGFTLIELLVGMTILLVILGLVFNATMQALGMQSSTEENVSLEAGLRRTTQILSQDLRNAAYGMLTSTPYPSTSTSISVARLTDTAVHAVLGPSTGFSSAMATDILSPATFSWPVNTPFLLINPAAGQKNATILRLTTAVNATGLASLTHVLQANTLCWSNDNLVQRVNLLGYSYNAAQKILYRQVQSAAGAETLPLAFGVSNFTLSYLDPSGTAYPSLVSVPATSTVARIGITLSMEGSVRGRTVTRTLTSSVEIPKIFTLTDTPVKYVAVGSTLTC